MLTLARAHEAGAAPYWTAPGGGVEDGDGSVEAALHRELAEELPAGSFGEASGLLGGIPVPVMSVAGMLAMKEQFPALHNGRPWRDKDIGDIAVLRSLRSGSF